MKKLVLMLMAGMVFSGLAYSAQKDWSSNVSYDIVISRDGVAKNQSKTYLKNNSWRVETVEHGDQGNTRAVITIIDSKKGSV